MTTKQYTRKVLDKLARDLAPEWATKIDWSVDFDCDGQEMRVLLTVTWPGGQTNKYLDG